MSINEVEITGKAVLVIGAFDVDDADNPRANSIREAVKLISSHGASKIKVIGHCETEFDLASRLKTEFPDVDFFSGVRKDSREKENNEEYAKELADDFDVYVNEDFATSHRKYTSLVALPKYMKSQGKTVCLGLRFEKEIQMLSLITPPNPPLNLRGGNLKGGDIPEGIKVLVIGGAKASDKEKYAQLLKDKFDVVLEGGLLAGAIQREDGLDISPEEIKRFETEIEKAGTIVVAGPMGKFEDPAAEEGTRRVFTAAANIQAYKVAGGGDTEEALKKFGLTEKFDWISVGGGAMLEFLATGTLPGIEAIWG